MMNTKDAYGGTKPILSTEKDFIEEGRRLYEMYEPCECSSYKKDGYCLCSGKVSIDNLGGGKNPYLK